MDFTKGIEDFADVLARQEKQPFVAWMDKLEANSSTDGCHWC